MKKIFVAVCFLFAVLAPETFGQTDVMLNLRSYSNLFINANGRLDRPYLRAATDEDYDRFAVLGGEETSIDTPLEIALLSNCTGVIDVRPAEANQMLGTPKQADLKLGAAVFQEMQVLRFLGDTAAVSRHEEVLRFITGRGNATRAEVETFYRNGIRGLVSEVVDEEFNKVSFSLSTDTDGANVLLIRKGNQFTIICEGYWGTPKVRETREFSGSSLDDLIRTMQASNSFRDTSSILGRSGWEPIPTYTHLRAQAALIPAVRLSDRAMNEIKGILTNFYTTPNAGTYAAVREVYSVYRNASINYSNMDLARQFQIIRDAYCDTAGGGGTLFSLNPELARKVATEGNRALQITQLSTAQQQRLEQLR